MIENFGPNVKITNHLFLAFVDTKQDALNLQESTADYLANTKDTLLVYYRRPDIENEDYWIEQANSCVKFGAISDVCINRIEAKVQQMPVNYPVTYLASTEINFSYLELTLRAYHRGTGASYAIGDLEDLADFVTGVLLPRTNVDVMSCLPLQLSAMVFDATCNDLDIFLAWLRAVATGLDAYIYLASGANVSRGVSERCCSPYHPAVVYAAHNFPSCFEYTLVDYIQDPVARHTAYSEIKNVIDLKLSSSPLTTKESYEVQVEVLIRMASKQLR